MANDPAYEWVPHNFSAALPARAFVAGHDLDRATLYIGRTTFEGNQMAIKVVYWRRFASLADAFATDAAEWDERGVTSYDLLVGEKLRWVMMDGDRLPAGAISTGYLADGEPCYVGRAAINGIRTPGMVRLSKGGVFVPFGNRVHFRDNYEILVAGGEEDEEEEEDDDEEEAKPKKDKECWLVAGLREIHKILVMCLRP